MTNIVHVYYPIRLHKQNFKDQISSNFKMVSVVYEALWGSGTRTVHHRSCCLVSFMNTICRLGAPVTGATRFFLPMQSRITDQQVY